MPLDINELENYVKLLTEDTNLIDNLSDKVITDLIEYLEREIKNKEEILVQLKQES